MLKSGFHLWSTDLCTTQYISPMSTRFHINTSTFKIVFLKSDSPGFGGNQNVAIENNSTIKSFLWSSTQHDEDLWRINIHYLRRILIYRSLKAWNEYCGSFSYYLTTMTNFISEDKLLLEQCNKWISKGFLVYLHQVNSQFFHVAASMKKVTTTPCLYVPNFHFWNIQLYLIQGIRRNDVFKFDEKFNTFKMEDMTKFCMDI